MEDKDKKGQEKKNKEEEKLPFCTDAPSAEHARANRDDEPCDDSRGAK